MSRDQKMVVCLGGLRLYQSSSTRLTIGSLSRRVIAQSRFPPEQRKRRRELPRPGTDVAQAARREMMADALKTGVRLRMPLLPNGGGWRVAIGEHRDGCHRPLLRAGGAARGDVIQALNFRRGIQSLVRYGPAVLFVYGPSYGSVSTADDRSHKNLRFAGKQCRFPRSDSYA